MTADKKESPVRLYQGTDSFLWRDHTGDTRDGCLGEIATGLRRAQDVVSEMLIGSWRLKKPGIIGDYKASLAAAGDELCRDFRKDILKTNQDIYPGLFPSGRHWKMKKSIFLAGLKLRLVSSQFAVNFTQESVAAAEDELSIRNQVPFAINLKIFSGEKIGGVEKGLTLAANAP